MKYFVRPPADAYLSAESDYSEGYRTYTEYNYLNPGLASRIKSWHFETALELTKEHFHNGNVIDFGCADGAFLPSLSKHFNHVCAIDRNPGFVKTASAAVQALGLGNVELLCNDGLSIETVKSRLSGREYQVLYLLETLEHVGDNNSLYPSKVHFLKEIASLIDKDGVIVVSVPNMVGPFFLVQRIGLTLTGSLREPISIGNLLKASFLGSTVDLEKRWNGGHLGFNHKKLEDCMKGEFRILRKRHIMFQVLYLITR
jgi:2-polyprenyl-3-methyl-5-hydroxy-6-metoxy-1,4-benzoquinol methylase